MNFRNSSVNSPIFMWAEVDKLFSESDMGSSISFTDCLAALCKALLSTVAHSTLDRFLIFNLIILSSGCEVLINSINLSVRLSCSRVRTSYSNVTYSRAFISLCSNLGQGSSAKTYPFGCSASEIDSLSGELQ